MTTAWMGFDHRDERSLGDEDASYTTAIPMWTDFMEVVVDDRKHDKVPDHTPEGIGRLVVDATRGGPPVAGMPQATIYFRTALRPELGPATPSDPDPAESP
ncbi:MAG TPA: hypothetical protein VM869_09430 [Enhygromyxa sp.]|nr:hypothetical protein [Enhygromyxa sp.]